MYDSSIYREKDEFVKKLDAALSTLPHVDKVEYKAMPELFSEYVKVTWHGGGYEFIAVTGDSREAINKEVARLIGNERPVGTIPSLRQAELINDIWERMEQNA